MVQGADIERLIDDGEPLRYQAPIRGGGRVGVTDDRVMVVRGDLTTSVHLETIAEVTVQSFDWFLGLLSLVVIGFGLLSFDRSILGGSLFVLFGFGSLYLTYRRRNQVQLHLHDRRKAVTFSLEDTESFRTALGSAIDRYQSRFEATPPD